MEEARDQARREHESAVAELTRATEHATDLEARISEANEKIERLQQTIDALRASSIVQAAQFDDQRREQDGRLAKAHDMISTLTSERLALQESLDRLTREHAAALATCENDIKTLQLELQKSRADNHRLFQQAPVPMFQCTKDGALTQANRVLTMLVGRRSPSELRGAEWAAAVFESPNDLSWLIERCLGSRGKESTETTWRRKDGSRLLVRVSVCAISSSSDLIEASVEDLTPIRVLNDRLSQAHRMEAVGRLATEVAVTCGSLLSSVHQNAQPLLMTDDSNPASRHRAEMLLGEISRAGGLLRQLAAYGDEESRKPAMVELRTVVRDLAPILKRVAGDAVDVQLPAAAAPLNVDAGAERVQRLLVNLAAYGRERMPLGGQLKIELGTIVVDRHFAAKHPNVRLGPHALVTVTESRRAARTDEPLQLPDNDAGSSSPSVAVQRRVDLGTLQELVAECGGHLWMTVEPVGDMVVKIRLPLVTSYGETPRRTFGPRGRVRTLGHWFQQKS
jgi:PAS domain S-box-containing protein